uniref:Coronin n=1 Tax=Anolis carolinensis TaxID=28377 RepID=A0A803SLJ2_ANOCA
MSHLTRCPFSSGVLGLVPLEAQNGGKRAVSQLCCHSDAVTDLDFSPFDEQILATGSADEVIKVWRLQDGDGDPSSSSCHVALGAKEGPVGAVLFHPTADGTLSSAARKTVKVWNVERQQALTELEPHEDQVQSLGWRPDGSLLGTSCKDKKLRIFDPRTKPTPCQSVLGHDNAKDSRLVWVNAEGGLLSVGFNQVREREVRLWDTRKFGSSLASVTLDASPRARRVPLCDGKLQISGIHMKWQKLFVKILS